MSDQDPKDKVEKIFSLMDKVVFVLKTANKYESRMAMVNCQRKSSSKAPNKTKQSSRPCPSTTASSSRVAIWLFMQHAKLLSFCWEGLRGNQTQLVPLYYFWLYIPHIHTSHSHSLSLNPSSLNRKKHLLEQKKLKQNSQERKQEGEESRIGNKKSAFVHKLISKLKKRNKPHFASV